MMNAGPQTVILVPYKSGSEPTSLAPWSSRTISAPFRPTA